MRCSRTIRAIGIVGAGLLVLASGRAVGQSCGPEKVGCLPDVAEHGSIADVPLAAPAVPSPEPPAWGTKDRELAPATIGERPDDADVRRGLPEYDPDDKLFVSSLAEKVDSLAGCRVDTARARRVRPGDLPAEAMHLRLWVTFDGRVSDSLVSTTGALGPDFVDCVKRSVRGWWLIPPENGGGAFVDVDVDIPITGAPKILSRNRVS